MSPVVTHRRLTILAALAAAGTAAAQPPRGPSAASVAESEYYRLVTSAFMTP